METVYYGDQRATAKGIENNYERYKETTKDNFSLVTPKRLPVGEIPSTTGKIEAYIGANDTRLIKVPGEETTYAEISPDAYSAKVKAWLGKLIKDAPFTEINIHGVPVDGPQNGSTYTRAQANAVNTAISDAVRERKDKNIHFHVPQAEAAIVRDEPAPTPRPIARDTRRIEPFSGINPSDLKPKSTPAPAALAPAVNIVTSAQTVDVTRAIATTPKKVETPTKVEPKATELSKADQHKPDVAAVQRSATRQNSHDTAADAAIKPKKVEAPVHAEPKGPQLSKAEQHKLDVAAVQKTATRPTAHDRVIPGSKFERELARINENIANQHAPEKKRSSIARESSPARHEPHAKQSPAVVVAAPEQKSKSHGFFSIFHRSPKDHKDVHEQARAAVKEIKVGKVEDPHKNGPKKPLLADNTPPVLGRGH